jgi:hyperosmotically inducible periplasmic protein
MRVGKHLILAGLVTFAASAAPARAIAQDTRPQAAVTDSSLDSRIEAAIEKDATLGKRDIDVDVSGGVVTLKGKVRTAAERAHAEQLATIPGVTRVQNDLIVDPSVMDSKADRAAEKTKAGTNKAIDATKDATVKTVDKTKEVAGKTASKTKEIAGKTADKTKEIAGKTADKSKDVGKATAEKSKAGASVAKDAGKDVGQKSKEAASTTGEAVTDAWLTTKVKGKLVDEDLLKGSDISVDTNDHVVTLKGTVASEAGKARAEEIARTTDGVKRVVNAIVVKQ